MRTVLLLSVWVLASCNFVRMERERVLEDLRQWGLIERHVELGDDTVRFWASGGSRPLLLLHGFGADAMWQFRGQRFLVGEGHKILMPDLLWFGGSHSTRRDFSLGHQADMVVALLDKAGFQRFDVVGVSYGGLVAYELARREPERVRRLVLVDSPGPLLTSEDRDAMVEQHGNLEDLLVPTRPEDVERLMQLVYFDPPWTPEFAAEQAIEEMYTKHREEKMELLRAAMSAVPEPETINEPTLVVWGREDPLFPVALGERLTEFIGAQLLVIDDARHVPNLEHHELFNERVAEFLR